MPRGGEGGGEGEGGGAGEGGGVGEATRDVAPGEELLYDYEVRVFHSTDSVLLDRLTWRRADGAHPGGLLGPTDAIARRMGALRAADQGVRVVSAKRAPQPTAGGHRLVMIQLGKAQSRMRIDSHEFPNYTESRR